MSVPIVRLLPLETRRGAENMAADEVILESAIADVASLRFYCWSEPTASLGYFQSARVLQNDPLLAPLPHVRRQSGGATLVHDREVTYGLALPPGMPWQDGRSWLVRMHEIISAALHQLGVTTVLHSRSDDTPFLGTLCFQHFTPGDVTIGPHKVVGSAQRRQRGALLQHGGILFGKSPHAPALEGIAELSGRTLEVAETREAISNEIEKQTGWKLVPARWTPQEEARTAELTANKYSSPAWNLKR